MEENKTNENDIEVEAEENMAYIKKRKTTRKRPIKRKSTYRPKKIKRTTRRKPSKGVKRVRIKKIRKPRRRR